MCPCRIYFQNYDPRSCQITFKFLYKGKNIGGNRTLDLSLFQYLLSIPEHKQNNDQQKFLPFYFVAQSLFYLIIFRWETIGIENLRDLNLQTIVFSKLNPLAELVPAVAIKFCDVMKETEILFGHVIIEQVDIVSRKTFLKSF